MDKWRNSAVFFDFFNDFFLIFFLCLTNMMYRPKRIFLCVGFGGISVRSTIYSKNILLDRYFVGAVIRNAFVANNAIFFSQSGQSTHKILTYMACLGILSYKCIYVVQNSRNASSRNILLSSILVL